MTNVAGHLREQNGMYQMILSWKDTDGKRRTKSISTGLPVKGNKKRAESLLRKTQKEFNPETMQQVSDLPVSEYLNRWLRESVMNLPPETYGRYAYDLGRVVVPYFEKKRLSLKALSPRDLETFFRYERQQEEASVQQLLDWHKELTDALQYAVDNNWLKVSPIKEVDPCLDNSPVLFTDFITDWLKMMKSRVEITTYTAMKEQSFTRSSHILNRSTIHCRIWNSIPNTSKTSTSMSWIVALRQTPSFTITPTSANACSTLFKSA